jgi:hypothetical protein
MGQAAHVLMPLPVAASSAVWSAGLTLLGVLLIVGGGYRLVERHTVVIAAFAVSLPIAAVSPARIPGHAAACLCRPCRTARASTAHSCCSLR